MKKLLIIAAAVLSMSCRSPLMVYDEETQVYMTAADKKALDDERAEEARAKAEAESQTATVTITIIIQ